MDFPFRVGDVIRHVNDIKGYEWEVTYIEPQMGMMNVFSMKCINKPVNGLCNIGDTDVRSLGIHHVFELLRRAKPRRSHFPEWF